MYKAPIRNTKLFEQRFSTAASRPELSQPITTNRAGGLHADICHDFRFSRDFFCQGNKHGDNMNYPPYNCTGKGCNVNHADGVECQKWRDALRKAGCPALGPGFDDWRPVVAKNQQQDLP